MAEPSRSAERLVLTTEEAIEMLPDGDSIHTFRQAGPFLIGADWTRAQVLAAIARWGAELSGPAATAARHGIVVIQDDGPTWIATRGVMPSVG